MAEEMRIDVMRSQLGRARGTGAAHAGLHHWWAERVTAVALIPLTLWFIWAVVAHVGAPYQAVRGWAGRPVNAALLLALVIMTFHHMQLGLQVVLEDYVDSQKLKTALVLLVKGASLFLGLLASLAVLRMAI